MFGNPPSVPSVVSRVPSKDRPCLPEPWGEGDGRPEGPPPPQLLAEGPDGVSIVGKLQWLTFFLGLSAASPLSSSARSLPPADARNDHVLLRPDTLELRLLALGPFPPAVQQGVPDGRDVRPEARV